MPVSNKKQPKKDAQKTSNKKNLHHNLPTSSQQISWPTLDPQCSHEALSLTHLVPGQIITIPRFWTAALCKKYVSFLSNLPLSTTPGVPKRGEAVRVNDRFQVEDAEFAELLWSGTALKNLVCTSGSVNSIHDDKQTNNGDLWGGEVVGLSPNIRVYRYRKGQFFDQHCKFLLFPLNYVMGEIPAFELGAYSPTDDDSNFLIHPGPPSTPSHTTWTLLLYLTSPTTGCIGGETVFYPDAETGVIKHKNKQKEQPEPVIVGLETGMALLHRHGRDCMLHEGREVLEGEKWVIRSDLCVKR